MATRADEIADLEERLHWYEQEHETLTTKLAVQASEITRLTTENAMISAKERDSHTKAVKIETIMRSVSSGLLEGLADLAKDRERQAAIRRQQQERVLSEETGTAPAFLHQRTPSIDPARSASVRRDVADQAPRPTRPTLSEVARREPVDLDRLADEIDIGGEHDKGPGGHPTNYDRLPPVEAPNSDELTLRSLADQIGGGRPRPTYRS